MREEKWEGGPSEMKGEWEGGERVNVHILCHCQLTAVFWQFRGGGEQQEQQQILKCSYPHWQLYVLECANLAQE